MQQIINFLIRNKNLLLYLFLLFISLLFTIQSRSYHQSKFINSANWLSGGIYSTVANIKSYFNLKQENQKLVKENQRLRFLLFNKTDSVVPYQDIDSAFYAKPFVIVSGKVLKNSFSKPNNYITINKGSKHGVKQDMGVISPNGIVGIIENTSVNFATAQTILNTRSKINAKIKNTNHFGTLIWDTKNPYTVQLIDIPRLAELKIGDTITTGGMSFIFPEGIPIGVIENYALTEAKNYYTINVKLFNDMTRLDNIYIIKNTQKKEADSLQQLLPDE